MKLQRFTVLLNTVVGPFASGGSALGYNACVRAVLQRVSSASVTVDNKMVAAIGRGWLVFLGVAAGDGESDAEALAEKVFRLRGFEDAEGRMNLDLSEAGGAVLIVSQFTLLADCRKGRRPGFDAAATPQAAERLYDRFCGVLSGLGASVERGAFRRRMRVDLANDGPVTFLLDSQKTF